MAILRIGQSALKSHQWVARDRHADGCAGCIMWPPNRYSSEPDGALWNSSESRWWSGPRISIPSSGVWWWTWVCHPHGRSNGRVRDAGDAPQRASSSGYSAASGIRWLDWTLRSIQKGAAQKGKSDMKKTYVKPTAKVFANLISSTAGCISNPKCSTI